MTDLRAAAEMALEALDGLSEPYDVLKAKEALRQALAQGEPVPSNILAHEIDLVLTDREAIKRAVRLLHLYQDFAVSPRIAKECGLVITALSTTLAQPEQVAMKQGWDVDTLLDKQEPVAWVKEGKVRVGFGRIEERKYVQFDQTLPIGTKLFAAPVSKQEPVAQVRLLQFLTDVVTAAGLLAHGKRDKGLSERISKDSFEMRRIAAPPPSKPWVSLTDDAIAKAIGSPWLSDHAREKYVEFARAIEAALKELNHG